MSELPSLIDAAEELARAAEGIAGPNISVTWEEFPRKMLRLTSIVCVTRQIESIKSATLLAKNNLGHLAPTFLRPSCEEYLWLSYLHSISGKNANQLLIALAAYDGFRGVIAQQQYTGKRGMKSLGFPPSFVKSAYASKAIIHASLEVLGARLGWPKSENDKYTVPPSAQWIAQQSGNGRLYDFLYSATSRSVHFSAGEIARRGWADPSDKSEGNDVNLLSDVHYKYRASFGLYWCCHILVLTMTSAADSLFMEEIGDEEGQRFEKAVEQVASFGKVPIVIPEEFNIRHGAKSHQAS